MSSQRAAHPMNLESTMDADFLALGLGGTGMMGMLWTVAMGFRAVGVEMRGDPFLGVHWNIRDDLYHQLGLIDEMMLRRYGAEGVPRRDDGSPFSLAQCFYSPATVAGDIVADEIISGYTPEEHIVGTIHHIEYIDDRWQNGVPKRLITRLQPPSPPMAPDPRMIRTELSQVLDGPSMFQAGAASVLILLRRYLEAIEREDLVHGRPPRVRLFTHHRVLTEPCDGFVRQADGKLRVLIEELQEIDFKGRFVRVRASGTAPIDLGVPGLIAIAQGFHSTDAERLGYRQDDVSVDHGDGRGPVVAQADYVAGLIEILVDGRLRRRIASEFDAEGNEYWVRQIAVGHENDPEVGWVLVQVPDFMNFCPIAAGLVPPGTDKDSPEFFAGFQSLLYDFYVEQSALVLDMPVEEVKRAQMVWGPKLFSLVERIGEDAQLAPNAVVAGDSFGNGHFMTSGGAMTGMIGHSARIFEYWQARARGVAAEGAVRQLADSIKKDTEDWLKVSATEFSKAVPVNFGAERVQQIAAASGRDSNVHSHAIDASRRQRHGLMPLDPSDWRRPLIRPGRVCASALPELQMLHPSLRAPSRSKNTLAAAPPAMRTGPRGMAKAPEAGTPMELSPSVMPEMMVVNGASSPEAVAVEMVRHAGELCRCAAENLMPPTAVLQPPESPVAMPPPASKPSMRPPMGTKPWRSPSDLAAMYNSPFSLFWKAFAQSHLHFGYWDETNMGGSFGEAVDRVNRLYVEAVSIRPNDRFLDVGCGYGAPALMLAENRGCQIDGVTIAESQWQQAQQNARIAGFGPGRVRFHHADAYALPFPNNTFDGAWFIESLLHIGPAEGLREASRVLKKGAEILIADWIDLGLTPEAEAFLREGFCVNKLISFEDAKQTLRDAGFEHVSTTDLTKTVAIPGMRKWLETLEMRKDEAVAACGPEFTELLIGSIKTGLPITEKVMGYGMIKARKA